jgi:hypothetical protein
MAIVSDEDERFFKTIKIGLQTTNDKKYNFYTKNNFFTTWP